MYVCKCRCAQKHSMCVKARKPFLRIRSLLLLWVLRIKLRLSDLLHRKHFNLLRHLAGPTITYLLYIYLFFIYFYVFGCFAYMYGIPCVCCAHRSQKRDSDPLELELEVVVSPHVGSWNGTWVQKKQPVLLTTAFSSSHYHF